MGGDPRFLNGSPLKLPNGCMRGLILRKPKLKEVYKLQRDKQNDNARSKALTISLWSGKT